METTASNDNDCPRFRPFASPTQRMIKVKKAKYSTSLDPRGYIPGNTNTASNIPLFFSFANLHHFSL